MSFDLEEQVIQCPYCGELISILIDTTAGSQQYYEDCSVCCAPIFLQIEVNENGCVSVFAKRDDE